MEGLRNKMYQSLLLFGVCLHMLSDVQPLVAQTTSKAPPLVSRREEPTALAWAQIAPSKQGVVSLALKSSGRCNFGDLDILLFELAANKKSQIIATVEPLLPEDEAVFTPITIPIAKPSKAGGLPGFSFPIKLPTRDVPVGIFVCKSSGPNERCGRKGIMSWTKMAAQYRPNAVATPNSSDKIHFFGFAVASSKGIRFPTTALSTVRNQVLESELRSVIGGKTSAVMQSIGRYNILSSMPLSMDGNSSIGVDLPHYNIEGCTKNRKRKNSVKK